MLNLVTSFTKLGTAAVLLVALAGAAVWFTAQDTIREAAPPVVWTLAAVIALAAILWLARYAVMQWLSIRAALGEHKTTEARQEADRTGHLAQTAFNHLDIALAEIDATRAAIDLQARSQALNISINQAAAGLIHFRKLGELGEAAPFPAPLVKQASEALPPGEDQGPPLVVRFEEVFNPEQASLKRLVLGAGPGGQLITGELRQLSHIGIGGTSRWGKSIFLQALLYQILVAGQAEVFLSDISGTSFVDFDLPYASTLEESERMAAAVLGEAKRRQALFEATGRSIRNLEIYNQVAGANLPYLAFLCDETTVLMSRSGPFTETLFELVAWGGKYGVNICLAGQNWKASNVDSVIRDQFSSRFQFKAMDSIQAGILIRRSGAEGIDVKGRAMAYLPEQGLVELQTPLISEATIRNWRQAVDQKPDRASPANETITASEAGRVASILDLLTAPDKATQVDPIEEPDPEPARPSGADTQVIETFVALCDGPDRFSWSELVRRLGWGRGGEQVNRARDILDRWGIDYENV